MSLDPVALLGGPRGRRLCLEVALARGERSEVQDAASAVMWAAHRLAQNPGTILAIGGDASDAVVPEVSPAQAADAVGRVRPRVDAGVVDAGLVAAVDLAAYWQPPYGEDVLAATADVVAVLRPWAESIVRETSTQWGRVIDVGELGASVLAGWGPDETFWLDPVHPAGPEECWAVDRTSAHRHWHRV